MYLQEYSNFPDRPLTLHHFKDVDDSVAPVIRQIRELQNAGAYGQAARIIEDNRDVLAQYLVDCTAFNTWEEEIYNTQVYALQNRQIVYADEMPPEYLCENDVWIGGA